MSKDYLLKAITRDGLFRAYAINATHTVTEAQRRHRTTIASTSALGRTIVGSLMLSTSVLEAGQTMTIRIDGKGPAGLILVDANANGDVKGFIQNPQVELPTNDANEVNVGKVVGKDGFMQVIKNLGSDLHPYTSNVHLISGQIGDDFTYYLNQSEQIPSAMDTSVLINANGTVGVAGGYLVQKMPGASAVQVAKVEKRIKQAPKMTALLSQGDRPEKLLDRIFGKNNLEELQRMPVQFKCSCSKKKFGRDIAGLKPSQIKDMIRKDHGAKVVCYFCGNHYRYTEEDLKALLILSEERVKKSK